MAQIEIMEYLDKNPGKLFTCNELIVVFKDVVTKNSVYRAMRKIIKRHEYSAKMVIINGQPTALYGRKQENGKEHKRRTTEGREQCQYAIHEGDKGCIKP